MSVSALKYSLLACALLLTSLPTSSQTVTELGFGDTYFQWRPAEGNSKLCGFSILGNHQSWKNPHVEWDLNIDLLISGDKRVAGVSAGTFDVVKKQRRPRQPISGIVFTLEDDKNPIPVQLVGLPNKDNGVQGLLDLGRSAALFEALSNEKRITITLTYLDGTTDILKARGFRDMRKFGRGKNSYLNECLRGLTPTPEL